MIEKPNFSKQRKAKKNKELRESSKVYDELEEIQLTCGICDYGGYKIELANHHIIHGAKGRKTYHGNVIRLCPSCHAKVHARERYWRPILLDKIKEIYKGGKYGFKQ